MSGATDTPLLALIGDDATRQTLRAVAQEMGLPAGEIAEGGAAAASARLQGAARPAVLVVDLSDSRDPVLDLTGLAGLCGGASAIIAVGQVNDVRFYRELRDAGAQDYLVKPVTREVFSAALSTALKQPRGDAPSSAKGARTIAFIGARGGVGVTCLALSTAWALAHRQKKVVLLDLDLHFGSAALSLDLEPGRGLREILAFPDRIDTLLIDAAAARAGEHLRLLGAEEPLEDSLQLSPEGLIAVSETLNQSAEFVIIDVPRVLSPICRQALAMADVVAVVTDLSLPAMRDTQRLVALANGLRSNANPVVIANRIGGVGGEIGVSEFERAIGGKIDHAIRFDKAAATAAAEAAKPLIEAAKTSGSLKALRGMVEGLSGSHGEGSLQKTAAPSLFTKVFGG